MTNQPNSIRRSGAVMPLVICGTLASVALGAYLYFSMTGTSESVADTATWVAVERSEFVAKVLDQGEVQSAENVEIKCQVGSRNGNVTVIDVIAEGSTVKGGDWLVTLDATAFEKEIEQQRLAVSNAETQVIQSKSSLAAAEATKEEYLQGTFVENEQAIENDIFNAEQEYIQNLAVLEHSKKLLAKGFLTKQQLRSDEIAVQRAEKSVDLAKKRLEVLRNITRKKNIIQLNSDIDAATVQVKNADESLAIEQRELAEVEKQLENCSIKVPDGVEGEVVFHKEFDRRGGTDWVLEPGATVRERQVLIKLPNPDMMEIKLKVNEQSITSIRPNMPATISVDALNGITLKGYVTKVNAYAEQSGWGGGSGVREYAVFVRIIDPPKQLIPGMNASISIQTEFQPDALQAPLQCIYSANNSAFVLKKTGENKFETVEVKIVSENSQNVWIESGVEEGDLLAMAPGQYKELMDLPEQEGEVAIDVNVPEGTAATSSESSEGDAGKGGKRSGKGGDRKGRGDKSGKKGGDAKQTGRPAGGSGGPPSSNAMVDRTMDRYDKNGDDVLDAEEFAEIDPRFSGMMKSADADGDGKYTREEITAAFKKMMERFQSQGGGGGGGRPGGGRPSGG